MPSTWRSARRTASSRVAPSVASAAIMWASASVSVSLTSVTPRLVSASLSCSAFSMMPLCTTAMRPSVSVCGCAFTSLGSPWVAHLVWPMPIVALVRSLTRSLRSWTRPAVLVTCSRFLWMTARPAES